VIGQITRFAYLASATKPDSNIDDALGYARSSGGVNGGLAIHCNGDSRFAFRHGSESICVNCFVGQ
jgi:hypothetical protein